MSFCFPLRSSSAVFFALVYCACSGKPPSSDISAKPRFQPSLLAGNSVPLPQCLAKKLTGIDRIEPADNATNFCDAQSCFTMQHADGSISAFTDLPPADRVVTIQSGRSNSELCIANDCVQLGDSKWTKSDSNSNYITVASSRRHGAKSSFPLGPNVSMNASMTSAVIRVQSPNDTMTGKFFVYDAKTGTQQFELKIQNLGISFRCSHPATFFGDKIIAVSRFNCDNHLPRGYYSGEGRIDLYDIKGTFLANVPAAKFPVGNRYPRTQQYITEDYPAYSNDFDPKDAVFVDAAADSVERKNWLTGESHTRFSVDFKKWFPNRDHQAIAHSGNLILANSDGALLISTMDGTQRYFQFPLCTPKNTSVAP